MSIDVFSKTLLLRSKQLIFLFSVLIDLSLSWVYVCFELKAEMQQHLLSHCVCNIHQHYSILRVFQKMYCVLNKIKRAYLGGRPSSSFSLPLWFIKHRDFASVSASLLISSIISNRVIPFHDYVSFFLDNSRRLTFVKFSLSVICPDVFLSFMSAPNMCKQNAKTCFVLFCFPPPTFHPRPASFFSWYADLLLSKYRLYWSFPSSVSVSARSIHYSLFFLVPSFFQALFLMTALLNHRPVQHISTVATMQQKLKVWI